VRLMTIFDLKDADAEETAQALLRKIDLSKVKVDIYKKPQMPNFLNTGCTARRFSMKFIRGFHGSFQGGAELVTGK